MSTDQTDLKQEVRECIRDRHERGNSHVKVSHISKDLDERSQRISPIVRDLVRNDSLEIWRETSNATVYRIHL